MKIRYQSKFILLVISLSLYYILSGFSCIAKAQTRALDELRKNIQMKHDSLEYLQISKKNLEHDFQQVNVKIYQYKKELAKTSNPIVRFRLDKELKSSRKMANQLEIWNREIQRLQAKLQLLYRTIIQEIDKEIQEQLKSSRQKLNQSKPSKSELEIIRSLEQEKSLYYKKLEEIQANEKDWENLVIEPGDSPIRIQMKIAILEDKLQNIKHTINKQQQHREELKKDQKVYQEMLDFYTELSQTVEDEQEFFDRNRIDELKDKSDEIAKQIKQLNNQIKEMEADQKAIQEKIVRFRAVQIKEE